MKYIVLWTCINLSLGATIRNQGESKGVSTVSKPSDQKVKRQLRVYSLNLYSSQNPLVIRAKIPNFATRTSDMKSRVLAPSLISQEPFKTSSFVLVPAKLQYSSITASASPNSNEQQYASSQTIKQYQSSPVKKEPSGYKIEKVPEVASFSRIGPQNDIPSISEIEAIFNNATRSTAGAKNYSPPLEPRTSLDENIEGLSVSDIAENTNAVQHQPFPVNGNNANTIANDILQSEVPSQSQTSNIKFLNEGRSVESSSIASVEQMDASNEKAIATGEVRNSEKSLFSVENDSESHKATQAPIQTVNITENVDVTDNVSYFSNHVINTNVATSSNTEPTSTSPVQISRENSIQTDNVVLNQSEHVQDDHSTESFISENYNSILSSNRFRNNITSETTDSPLSSTLNLNEVKSEPNSASEDSNRTNEISDNATTDNIILSNTESVLTSSYGSSSESSTEMNEPIQVDDNSETNTSEGDNTLFPENVNSSSEDMDLSMASTDQAAVQTVDVDLDTALNRNDEGNIIKEANLDLSTNVPHAYSDIRDSVETTTGFYSETTIQ